MTVSPPSPTLAAPDRQTAAAAVRARGLRLTASRRLVIEGLFLSDGPVSAPEIGDGLGGRLPRSDVAAVYRNLEALEEIGLVRHVHLGHGPGRWMLADRARRDYLHCERCGASVAVEPSTLSPAKAAIREATGYEARFTHFPVVGLCPGCAAAEDGRPREHARDGS